MAAAANLQNAFTVLAAAFERATGVRAVISYASTAQLSRQIANGAPFDVFAAADVDHVNQLVTQGHIVRESRRIFARGVLALWVSEPDKVGVRSLAELANPHVRFVAIANPETAPYGKAALEALKKTGLWQKLEGRVAYANNIAAAKQYVATGNADAALTAMSLVQSERGLVLPIDERLYTPLDHAIGVVTHASNAPAARRFLDFVTNGEGTAILRKFGYKTK